MHKDDPRIYEEYENRRTASILWRIVVVALAIGAGAILGKEGGTGVLLLKIVLVVGLALSVWRLIAVWRCPVCNTAFGRETHTRHCPHCGVQLEL